MEPRCRRISEVDEGKVEIDPPSEEVVGAVELVDDSGLVGAIEPVDAEEGSSAEEFGRDVTGVCGDFIGSMRSWSEGSNDLLRPLRFWKKACNSSSVFWGFTYWVGVSCRGIPGFGEGRAEVSGSGEEMVDAVVVVGDEDSLVEEFC
jgi:hypothetical protein